MLLRSVLTMDCDDIDRVNTQDVGSGWAVPLFCGDAPPGCVDDPEAVACACADAGVGSIAPPPALANREPAPPFARAARYRLAKSVFSLPLFCSGNSTGLSSDNSTTLRISALSNSNV